MPEVTLVTSIDIDGKKIQEKVSVTVPPDDIIGKDFRMVLSRMRVLSKGMVDNFEEKIGRELEGHSFVCFKGMTKVPINLNTNVHQEAYKAYLQGNRLTFFLDPVENINDPAAAATSSSSSSSSRTLEDLNTSPTAHAAAQALRLELSRLTTASIGNDANTVVFIGVGSCNLEHDDANGRADRQQCPQGLLDMCLKHGFSLHILLVDDGFSGSSQGQVFGRSNWTRSHWDEKQGTAEYEYRSAKQHTASASPPRISIKTYATRVDEYLTLNEGRLAGVSIAANFATMSAASHRSKMIALVCGNFFEPSTTNYFISADEFRKSLISQAIGVHPRSPALKAGNSEHSPEPLSLGGSSVPATSQSASSTLPNPH